MRKDEFPLIDAYADSKVNEVLDKIRAEIDKIYEREGSSFDCLNALDELKEFIDKREKYCPLREVEAIPKDQYEARLKADMVAMLTEIQLEIEELDNPLDYDFEGYNQCAVDCEKLIQQKIDALKGENT